MLTWHYLTSETFDAGEAAADGLYFLSDTKEIYRGDELFSGTFVIMDDADSDLDTVLAGVDRPAHGKIYLSKTTLEGRVYDGAAWQTVIRPVATAITDGGTGLVTADQVHDYVAEQIAGITGGENFVHNITCANGVLTVEGGDGLQVGQYQRLVELRQVGLIDGCHFEAARLDGAVEEVGVHAVAHYEAQGVGLLPGDDDAV